MRAWPAILGLVAFLAVVATLGGPGVTIDEPLDVRPGRTYVETLLRRGPGFFAPEVVRDVFDDNAEHPPLGRWLLGIASVAGEPFESLLGGPDPFGVHAGRLAPAFAFGLLVALVAGAAAKRAGTAGGLAAGLSLVMMPRTFAHAHLAALDTFVALTWTAAFLAADRAIGGARPTRAMALAGLVWGLALLTKIHGWLLVPPVVAFTLIRLGPRRSIGPVLAWGAAGVGLFVAAWPWLWYDTSARIAGFFRTGVERISLRVLYFDQVYADREVPWHYPWVYFALTVPVGLHLLGVWGALGPWLDRRSGAADDGRSLRILATIGMWLVLFSTRVPVYDGERLFLPVFPLWALLIGDGFGRLWRTCRQGQSRVEQEGPATLADASGYEGQRAHGNPKRQRGHEGANQGPSQQRTREWPWGCRAIGWRRGLAAGIFLAQGYGTVTLHPFGLSYYNALIGGLPGAERLGLELTYWSDAIDRTLLDELATAADRGDTAAIVPTLHHLQAPASMTAGLASKGVTLVAEQRADVARWLVVSRRTAYWPEGLPRALERTPPRRLRTRQGVWLSGLWPGPAGIPAPPN